MLRVISSHRPAVIQMHHARIAGKESDMESYRNSIIAMLDSVQDAALMRAAYEVLKALFMNWHK